MKARQSNKTKIVIPHAFIAGSSNQMTYAFSLQYTCDVLLHARISYIVNSSKFLNS